MPSADRLVEFVQVVDAGSISSAARQLGLPRATLSRRMTGLEEELGVRLLHRETRKLSLTYAGQQLIGRARRLVADTAEAWLAVRQLDDAPHGRLRVSLPSANMFQSLFLEFIAAYPDVELELAATSRRVDLRAEGVDVAMRFGSHFAPNLIARKLWTDRVSPVASVAYLDRHGRPQTADELSAHRCVLSFAEGWRRRHKWQLRAGGTIEVDGRLVSDEVPMRLSAALVGIGITMLPDSMTAPHRASGQLEFVLADQVGTSTTGCLVYPERALMPPQVRAFIDYTTAFMGRDGSLKLDRMPATSAPG